jgi:HEPN domain-containing protein
MRPEVKNWWKQANKDLEVAEKLFEARKYEYCSFWCQQAVEKALNKISGC